jgi:hypothetical protein
MATGHSSWQLFDLPELQSLIVTEHRAHDCLCAACGARTRVAFPDWVMAPVQHGNRIGAIALYLLHYNSLPEKHLATLMADPFGMRLATATIARISSPGSLILASRFRTDIPELDRISAQGFPRAITRRITAMLRRRRDLGGVGEAV